MPQPGKRKRALQELPSSATREIVSYVRKDGRLTKKRALEAVRVDPRAPPLPICEHGSLASEVAPSQPSDNKDKPQKQDASKGQQPGNKSRSVSVSATCIFHIITRSSVSRLKLRSGFHTESSTSTNFFVWKLLLKKCPASRVNHLRLIVV